MIENLNLLWVTLYEAKKVKVSIDLLCKNLYTLSTYAFFKDAMILKAEGVIRNEKRYSPKVSHM